MFYIHTYKLQPLFRLFNTSHNVAELVAVVRYGIPWATLTCALLPNSLMLALSEDLRADALGSCCRRGPERKTRQLFATRTVTLQDRPTSRM